MHKICCVNLRWLDTLRVSGLVKADLMPEQKDYCLFLYIQ